MSRRKMWWIAAAFVWLCLIAYLWPGVFDFLKFFGTVAFLWLYWTGRIVPRYQRDRMRRERD